MLKNLRCMDMIDASPAPDEVVTVVSGLPRSGTSMMMRVLSFGGMAPLTDAVRAGDSHNPHGYFEYEPVKHDAPYHGWMDQAAGRAVKLVSRFVPRLPATHRYKVLFMHREIEQVIRSQRDMALHYSGADWQARTSGQLIDAYRANVSQCLEWMRQRPNVDCLELHYEQVLAEPRAQVQRIADFLAPRPMDFSAMVDAIDHRLNHAENAQGECHA
jgi:hypothetical protein